MRQQQNDPDPNPVDRAERNLAGIGGANDSHDDGWFGLPE
jgi:hypothetical protein